MLVMLAAIARNLPFGCQAPLGSLLTDYRAPLATSVLPIMAFKHSHDRVQLIWTPH